MFLGRLFIRTSVGARWDPPHPPALRPLLRPSSAAARSDRLFELICTGGERTTGAPRDSLVERMYCSLPCSIPPRRDGDRRLVKHPPHTLRLRLSLLLQAGRGGWLAAREGCRRVSQLKGCAHALCCVLPKKRVRASRRRSEFLPWQARRAARGRRKGETSKRRIDRGMREGQAPCRDVAHESPCRAVCALPVRRGVFVK